jgi:two-component system cell cycle sensor histidine kinase/response regulator CckA
MPVDDGSVPSPVGVLIVVDDPPLLRLLELVLQKDGLAVHSATSGVQAVNLYEQLQKAIDVVLLEVDMHRMDGVQTMVALQQINPDVRCCCIAGGDAKYTVEEMQAWGARHVFIKPFINITELGDILRDVVTG